MKELHIFVVVIEIAGEDSAAIELVTGYKEDIICLRGIQHRFN